MHMQAIYVKTPKGIEEMTSRKYKLSIKERHVLIMLNGKRTLQEAAATLGPEDSGPVLGRLTAEGFITALSTPAAEPAPSAGAAPAAPADGAGSAGYDAPRLRLRAPLLQQRLHQRQSRSASKWPETSCATRSTPSWA